MKRLIALCLAFLFVFLALITPIVGPSWLATTAYKGAVEKGHGGLLYGIAYLMVTLFQAIIVIAILSAILIRSIL